MSTKFIIDSMLPAKYQQFHPQQLFSSATPGTIQACTTSPATASLESSLSAAAVAAAAVNYAQQHNSPSPTGSSPQHSGSSASTSPAARTTSSMYPYVSAAAAHHHHQQQQAVAAAAFGATSSMVPGFGSTAASSAALAAAAAVDAATAGDKSCRYTASLTGNVAPASADPMVNYTLGHHHQNGATPGSLVSSASASSAVSAASASMAAAAQFYHQAAAASAVVDPLTSCQQPTTGQPGISDIPRYPWMSITDWMSPFDRVVCVLKRSFSKMLFAICFHLDDNSDLLKCFFYRPISIQTRKRLKRRCLNAITLIILSSKYSIIWGSRKAEDKRVDMS
ncbi:Homeobox protein abdominal-A-like protein [Acromyrmex echinatior]|uniref:Homeobox protein abdominal-A-like protein n=1 Tax=Acromyrmex echinatior TaxID=103372 RepID=F4WN87_ACREC|nr:Homeobox protein abdominal-A-like protein [Acromyrmex echinatior]